MILLNNLNITLNELQDLRNNQDLTWDEIGIKLGKARNTIKRTIIKQLGEDVWKKLCNKEIITTVNTSPKTVKPTKSKPKAKVTTVAESKPKDEPITQTYFKYFITTMDEGKVLVTVYLNGEKYSRLITSVTELLKVQEAIKAENFEELKDLLSISKTLENNEITYDMLAGKFNIKGIELNENCRQLVMKCYKETVNGTHNSLNGLIAMVHNLNKVNKLYVLDQLYNFLKHNDIEILKDGSFICYKYLSKVNNQYVDSYTETVVQQVGDYVYTHEEKVDNDPNKTCSYGLHTAAWDYVSNKSIIAKIRVLPEDVVSVPVDYNGAKLRSKGYTILEILEDNPMIESFTSTTQLDLQPKNSIYVNATKK